MTHDPRDKGRWSTKVKSSPRNRDQGVRNEPRGAWSEKEKPGKFGGETFEENEEAYIRNASKNIFPPER